MRRRIKDGYAVESAPLRKRGSRGAADGDHHRHSDGEQAATQRKRGEVQDGLIAIDGGAQLRIDAVLGKLVRDPCETLRAGLHRVFARGKRNLTRRRQLWADVVV